jgi:hypothetical protein
MLKYMIAIGVAVSVAAPALAVQGGRDPPDGEDRGCGW